MRWQKTLMQSLGVLLLAQVLGLIFSKTPEVKKVFFNFGDVMAVLTSFAATCGMFLAFLTFRAWDYAKKSWFMLFIGMALYFIAEGIYAFCEYFLKMDMDMMFPGVADWFWLAGYLFLTAGFIFFLLDYRATGFPFGSKKMRLVLFTIWIALLGVIWSSVLVPIFNDGNTNSLERFVYCSYLFGDVILIALCMLIVAIFRQFRGGLFCRPWRHITLGFILIMASDIAYSYLTWQGGYSSGGLIDAGWSAGYLLIALGGICQQKITALSAKR